MRLASTWEHVRGRGRLLLGVAAVALVARTATPRPPEKTVEGIATMLGREAGGTVLPDQFLWEPRSGAIADEILGRRVLFIARLSGPDGAPAGDLFRARVRLSRNGRAISVSDVRNLTRTPLGDDRDLVARGRYVAFSTGAFGAVQGVTVLDLEGDRADREAKTRREHAQAAIESFLDTGAWQGLGRIEIAFGAPPPEVALDMAEGSLVMALGPSALPAALDPATVELNTGASNPFLAKAQRIPHPVRPFAPIVAEATQRYLGERPSRAVGEILATFGWAPRRNDAKGAGDVHEPPADPSLSAADPQTATPTTPAQQNAELWPPPPIAPQIQPPMPDEGAWRAVASPLLPKPNEGAEAKANAFFEASIRPDPARPEATVRLVAMDMRQLEIRVEAGFDEPRPAAGPRGSGRLPSGPLAERVVAAFAGGHPPGFAPDAARPGSNPAAAAAEVGMIVDRRILIPPAPNAFTVAALRDGRATLGPWPFGSDLPEWIISLRQSPASLIAAGAVVPQQGAAARAHASDRVERAGLCVTRAGHLIYAWGTSITASALAKALALADCEAGAHLGGTPARSGFAFLKQRADANSERAWDAELLSPSMSLPLRSLSDRSPSEIFYLVTRSAEPSAQAPTEGEAWSPDAGTQPTPAWIPAIFMAKAAALGADITVRAFSPDRFVWRVRAGTREPARKRITMPSALEPDDLARARSAIGLSAGRRKGGSPRGLSISGAAAFAVRGGAGALIVAEKGLAIIRSGDLPPDLAADAIVELPLLADEGKVLPEGRKVGARRDRAAACVLGDGTLLVATTTFDSEEASIEILLRAGCSRIISLDRGAHQPAFVHRAGTEAPPLARYEQSVLYALDAPMRGRTQTFAAAPRP